MTTAYTIPAGILAALYACQNMSILDAAQTPLSPQAPLHPPPSPRTTTSASSPPRYGDCPGRTYTQRGKERHPALGARRLSILRFMNIRHLAGGVYWHNELFVRP